MFCWSVHSKVTRLSKHAHRKQKKHSHTNSAVSRDVYVHPLLVQHLWSVFLHYMIWYGPKSENVYMQERQKNWLKYTNCAELKNLTIRIYSDCSIYYCFSSSPLNFVAVHFVCFFLNYS